MSKKRFFVPLEFKSDSVSEVTTIYTNLLNRVLPPTPADLRAWILQWSELEAVLSEESARRYVAMTCNTQDEEIAKAYAYYIENIDPIMSEFGDKLRQYGGGAVQY